MQFSYEVSEIHHRLGAAKESQARLNLTCKKEPKESGEKQGPDHRLEEGWPAVERPFQFLLATKAGKTCFTEPGQWRTHGTNSLPKERPQPRLKRL